MTFNLDNKCGYNVLRFFFGVAFVVASLDKVFHFAGAQGMFSGLFGGLGTAMLVVAIIIELGGGLALLAGFHVREATIALGVLLLVALVSTFKIGQADLIGSLREILVMNTGGGNTAVTLAYLAGLCALHCFSEKCCMGKGSAEKK